MASFKSLPAETVLQVAEYLTKTDLYSLCLACRATRNPAQARLYAKIELWWDAKSTPAILSLLNALISRPGLASCVTELILDGSHVDFFDHLEPADAPPPRLELDHIPAAEIDLYEASLPSNAPVVLQALWARELRRGTMDAFVTLLISLLPRLRSLTISNSFAKEVGILGNYIRSTIVVSPVVDQCHLDQIRRVTYVPHKSGRRTQKRYTPADSLALFYLPKLTDIEVWITNPTNFSWPGPSPPQLTALVNLSLVRIRERHLEQILRHTPRLRYFRWEWFYDFNGEPDTLVETINLEQVFCALEHVKSTLQDLTIRVTTDKDEDVDPILMTPFTLIGSMRPLKGFERLKSVGTLTGFFFGFESSLWDVETLNLLPASVEKVALYEDLTDLDHDGWAFDTTVTMVHDWFERWLPATPRLRNLDYHTGHWRDPLGDRSFDLSVVCEDFGITFTEYDKNMAGDRW